MILLLAASLFINGILALLVGIQRAELRAKDRLIDSTDAERWKACIARDNARREAANLRSSLDVYRTGVRKAMTGG